MLGSPATSRSRPPTKRRYPYPMASPCGFAKVAAAQAGDVGFWGAMATALQEPRDMLNKKSSASLACIATTGPDHDILQRRDVGCCGQGRAENRRLHGDRSVTVTGILCLRFLPGEEIS